MIEQKPPQSLADDIEVITNENGNYIAFWSMTTKTTNEMTDNSPAVKAEEKCAVTAETLNFYYGQKQALFDINIKIPDKSVTAFIGPSGCGKSTFLRTINRMNDIIPDVRLTGK